MAGAALLLATAAAACNGTTSTTTPATPAPALANVAGQYRGTVADTAFGNGKALGDFSQTGSTVGGRLRLTYAGKKVLNSVAMTLARSGALSGDAVATIGQTACTFSVSANYDATSFALSGSYAATTGCSGESGTFAMKEVCYYQQSAGIRNAVRSRHRPVLRPNAGGLHGC